MEDEETYSKKTLHHCSYRHLQQLAKSMGLPCNIKKVYLIELIRAKKFSSESEVKSIVQRVKMERQHLAQVRKSYKKANIKNEDNIYYKKPQSPPITSTPKRTGVTMHCSPDLHQAIIRYKQKQSLARVAQRTYPSPKLQNGSDRVLRSFNVKTNNRNAGIFNVQKTVLGVIKAQSRGSPEETQIEIVSHEGNMPKFNLTAKCLVKKHKPGILGSSTANSDRIYENRQMLQANDNKISPPAKRERTVSGIYPLSSKETPNKYGYLQSVGLRGRDDKEIQNNLDVSNHQLNVRANENIEDLHSVYYHKKIRAEQIRCNRFFNPREQFVEDDRLPKINEVFTQFRDVTQPLYVQVSEDSESVDIHPVYAPRNNTNTGMLENIYNFRTHRSWLRPAETGLGVSRLGEFYTQDTNSPEPGCASIPEMVEDALEIISQDGDYMERIGMDVRVPCMLCSWAGPMVMLEYHIKKEHSDQIYKENKNEWNITFTLGSLVHCQLCLSHVVEYDSTLYILSAKYEDPDCFMASISTLNSEGNAQRLGSITVYNKVTGEPHLWQGPVRPLDLQHPQPAQVGQCLKVGLSRLDLLPNSANLKLLNRELVNDSPCKVVVGHPELNDIHIILFVKIFE
ncbi:unnamed protein product, partial [Iphiclides podalirius]